MLNLESERVSLLANLLREASGARTVTIVFDAEPGELEDALIARNQVLSIASRQEKMLTDRAEDPLPKPGGSAGVDRGGTDASDGRAGEAGTSAGIAAEIAGHGGLAIANDLELVTSLRSRGFVGEIAEELADIAKEKGMYANVSIHISLDGRPDVAGEPENA